MNNRLHPLFYIGPFVLFLFMIHGFYSKGYLNLFVDAKVNCIYTNYFLNNIMRGVYPFWNPFSSWGRPDDLLAHMMGEFNPFLYIIVVLQKSGMPFSLSYFAYLIFYFTLGIAGVYFLAKELFKDPLIAWLGAMGVMFSNLSANLFNNIFVILIFVPTVWFFYFLIRFTQNPQKSSLLGLIFCLMILLTTYMPFHFLVIFLTFLLFSACIYAHKLPAIIHRCFLFISGNKIFTLFCLLSLLLSAIPGFLWYQSNLKNDVIYGWRGTGNALALDRGMIDSGNFVFTHVLTSSFSNLQDIELSSIYIPFIFILVALLGMILPLSRRRLLLFAMAIFFFLLISTNASPLTGFLYQHIFFFRYFRNPHFFAWGLGIMVALLVMDIFQGLLELPLNKKFQRLGLCALAVSLHLLVLIILKYCWAVNNSTYVTLALSGAFFIFYYIGAFKRGNILFLLMVFAIFLLQPAEVLWHVEQSATQGRSFPYSLKPYSYEESKPKFSYLRPSFSDEDQMVDTDHRGDVSDQSGFVKDLWQYHGTRWSFTLLKNFSFPASLQEYVRHKFVLYGPHQNVSMGTSDDFPAGEYINSDSNRFKVTSFDMNYIQVQTAFNQDQFLVYNDSYNADWQAFINGQRVPIVRANAAFKGIYVPAGKNTVLFSFHTPLYRGFFILLIIYFHLVLIILAFLLFRRGNDNV